jgi:hypothetical protein
MTFFYDLNKKLATLSAKQELNESVGSTSGFLEASTGDYSAKKARAGKDIGKPGKMFSKIAKSAGERYGSKERGEKVAGAVLAKLRAKESVEESDMDESALQAYLGKKKYGETGMKALQKAGREGASKETMAKIRAKHDKMDEADMEEGNKFTGNLMKARAAGLKKADLDGDGDMETVREADVVGLGEKKKAKPDYIDLDQDGDRKETMKKAAADKKKSRSAGTAFDPEVAKSMYAHKDDSSRYDVKDTGYSKRYTRKPEPEADQDDEAASNAPKKKGRPAGTKRAIGAKGPTGKSKLMKKDAIKEMDSIPLVDKGEYDREGEMAKQQMHTIMRAAKKLHSMLGDDDNLPEWVQKKITLAQNYIDGVADYMVSVKAEAGEEMPIAEKAVSVAQRRAAGIAHAAQKGEIPKSELRGASKEMAKMPKGELKKFAKTKETGLPKKVSETDAEAKPAKKGGFEFGKGIYESMDSKFRQALTEGMNISVNMNTGPDGQPSKNITVSADGEDAEALAALLKMAGISGHSDSKSCGTCGKAPCGCEELDENSPDWPTNTETSDNALQYSGGLNGPKSTGQTTVPVIASQLRRQVSMEESVKLENDLFRLYQNYKAQ